MTAEAVTVCPWCLRVNELATALGDSAAVPRPGDISICIDCGGLAVFDHDHAGELVTRMPTLVELDALANDAEAGAATSAALAALAALAGRGAMTDAPSYVLTVHQVLGERPTGHLRCVTRMPTLVARLCPWDAAVELEPLDDAGLAIARAIGMWTAHAAEAHAAGVAAALSSPVVEGDPPARHAPPEGPPTLPAGPREPRSASAGDSVRGGGDASA